MADLFEFLQNNPNVTACMMFNPSHNAYEIGINTTAADGQFYKSKFFVDKDHVEDFIYLLEELKERYQSWLDSKGIKINL